MKLVQQFVRREDVWGSLWRGKIERYLCRANARFYQERGHKMAVYANDFISVKIFTEGIFERVHLETLQALLERLLGAGQASMTALDIGANIGNHSLFFAGHFNRVLAFEPHPYTYQLLSLNAQARPGISTFNLGLGDTNGPVDLYEDAVNAGASSTTQPTRTATRKVTIQVRRLDDAGLEVGNVGLVKIDVEGMELQVLQGAAGLIQAQQPVIVIEQLARDFDGESSESPAIRLLRSWGYQFCWLERQAPRPSWPLLGIPRVIEWFRGRTVRYDFKTSDFVPKATYDMLVAVPGHLRHFL